ncbi:MAG: hypothetical protein JRJ82_03660 [Deltaproteobacteria bacterium]|nr:hypothetical protein [Deltaproteobacteria bacterium]
MRTKRQKVGGPGLLPWPGVIGGALLVMILALSPFGICHGYIMPLEQILQRMAANFSGFATQVIVQSTQRKDGSDPSGSILVREKVWAKSPDLFHSQVLDEDQTRKGKPDLTFRQLLVSNSPERIRSFLESLGVDLKRVSFSRFNGIIVYQIGTREPDSPKIFIDKETFLPILLQYRTAENPGGGTALVEFRDFRKVDKGWYPFEVSFMTSNGIEEIYTLETMETNVPIDITVFVAPERPSGQSQEKTESNPSEQERLRHIIKTFEEKYR